MQPAEGLRIIPFDTRFTQEAAALIVSIQRDEFGVPITIEDQPDLLDIPNFYQTKHGNFWLALYGEKVVGTIALLDIGGNQVALRKMFVHPDFRGAAHGTAAKLLSTALAWARAHAISDTFLGTTAKFLAAHRFYEKNGFREIPKTELPPAFPVLAVDSKFYVLSAPF